MGPTPCPGSRQAAGHTGGVRILVCRHPARLPVQLQRGAGHGADPGARGRSGTEMRNPSWLCQMPPGRRNRLKIEPKSFSFAGNFPLICMSGGRVANSEIIKSNE